MPETGPVWTDEKIVAAAKVICGVKDFSMVSKLKLMAKIVSMDVENQVLIRELYFAKPEHEFFAKWNDEERKHFDAMKPAPVISTTSERVPKWKSICQGVLRSLKI